MYSESDWATDQALRRLDRRGIPPLSGRRRFACVLSLLALAACGVTPPNVSQPPEAPAPVIDAAPAPAETATRPQPRRLPTQLTIAAVGDMMLGTDYPENRLPDDNGVSFLGKVAPILRAADLTFGNLEGVLADTDATPAKQCVNLNACYLFRSPPRYAHHLRNAGFDAMSLANNHARDFGEEGRSASMRALRDVGIAHSGRRGDFASINAKGLKVAFVAFAVTRNSNLLHDYPLAESIVLEQTTTHDIVVVSFHGGAEGAGVTRIPFAEETYYGEPRGDVVRFARSMVDAGADLVFGHGPHVVRGMERYRERLIAYSLGNFATYYGISVSGDKGIAPILVATLDEEGRFIEGRLHSTVQVRPGGPEEDPAQGALTLVRTLSRQDFRDPGLRFENDGRLAVKPRSFIR